MISPSAEGHPKTYADLNIDTGTISESARLYLVLPRPIQVDRDAPASATGGIRCFRAGNILAYKKGLFENAAAAVETRHPSVTPALSGECTAIFPPAAAAPAPVAARVG